MHEIASIGSSDAAAAAMMPRRLALSLRAHPGHLIGTNSSPRSDAPASRSDPLSSSAGHLSVCAIRSAGVGGLRTEHRQGGVSRAGVRRFLPVRWTEWLSGTWRSGGPRRPDLNGPSGWGKRRPNGRNWQKAATRLSGERGQSRARRRRSASARANPRHASDRQGFEQSQHPEIGRAARSLMWERLPFRPKYHLKGSNLPLCHHHLLRHHHLRMWSRPECDWLRVQQFVTSHDLRFTIRPAFRRPQPCHAPPRRLSGERPRAGETSKPCRRPPVRCRRGAWKRILQASFNLSPRLALQSTGHRSTSGDHAGEPMQPSITRPSPARAARCVCRGARPPG